MSTDEVRAPERRTGRALDAGLLTVAIYTFAGWTYIALNAVVHPVTLGLPLTHLAAWPHEDTFGVMCFAVSFACALAYAIRRVA